MQTFLPYDDFKQSAKSLDYRRLGKQRVEAFQILNNLIVRPTGWKNHPAVKMWKGYEVCLSHYMQEMINEWINRGYKNTMVVPIINLPYIKPFWLGDERVHASHRAALLTKLPEWYRVYKWKELPIINYYWPV